MCKGLLLLFFISSMSVVLGEGFPAGTLVLMRGGYKCIEDIEPGDLVYSHDQSYRLASVLDRKKEKTNNVVCINQVID